MDRIDKLKFLLEKANHDYYCLDSPTVSDYTYDGWMRELILLEDNNPDINSPTQTVGCQMCRR